jgi:phosphatidylglycerophosphatase A
MRTLAVVLATAGGLGYAPVAPGTVGSCAAVPLVRAVAGLREGSAATAVVLVALVVATAVWAAGRAAVVFGAHDHGRVVIDEVAGMAVAGLFVPATWTAALLVLGLFRVFDIAKPFPAGRIDREVRGGLGVVGDDLVAGVYAGAVAGLVMALA